MTTEQLAELAEALSILSAKSSVLKERNELRALMEENLSAEEVTYVPMTALYELTGCSFPLGSEITLSSSQQAHPYYVDEDRSTDFRIRLPCRQFASDDIMRPARPYTGEGPQEGPRCHQA